MSTWTGTGRLLRLALRRDRVQLPVWLVGLTGLNVASAASTIGLYPTEADRVSLARGLTGSPVGLAFNGIVSGTSEGATVLSQTFVVTAFGAALMGTLAVVRHTRQNEETGRADLLGAAAVGRHSLLAAGVLVALGANVVLAVANALAFLALGLPVTGSLLSGAALGAVGLGFVAVAAVAAQTTSHARGANGVAAAAVVLAFLSRALGDSTGSVAAGGLRSVSSWPSWLTPMGWGQQVRAYDDDRWWPLGLCLLWTVAMLAVAGAVARSRDVGAGLVADRPGPPAARPYLLRQVGLAWRLQRSVLLGWTVGVAVLATSFGAVSPQVEDLIGDSAGTTDVLDQLGGGGTVVEAYLSAMLGLVGLAVAGYSVQALLRLRDEETAGTLELVLATAVGRYRWLVAHLVVVLGGTVLLLLVAGLGTGLAYGIGTGGVGQKTAEVTVAALAYVPAAFAVAGLAVAAFGLVPGLSRALAWAGFSVALLFTQVGELLGLPQLLLDLSPFTHVPTAPSADLTAAPLVALGVVAAGLTAAGMLAFGRRDVNVA